MLALRGARPRDSRGGDTRASSPQHARVPRIVRARWLEAEPDRWGRGSIHGGGATQLNAPVGGGSRTPLQLSVLAFRLTSQLCAGQKVALYRRYLTVPLFFFYKLSSSWVSF